MLFKKKNKFELEEEQKEKEKESAKLAREKKKFLLKHTNASREDLLKLIFDLQKRLEKLESGLDSVSSHFMRL